MMHHIQAQDSSKTLVAFWLGLTSIRRFCSQPLLAVLISLICLPMAWSQPSPFYALSYDYGYKVKGTAILGDTSPGLTIFQGQALSMWCGTDHLIHTQLQASPKDSGEPIYTSNIFCGGAGRVSLAVNPVDGKVYAVGQLLNQYSYNQFTIISSSDGINWQSTKANVSQEGYQDGTFDQSFGLAAFNNHLYLAYLSVATGTVSVASSTDGVNFTWQGSASSAPMYNEPQTWAQSPALYYWSPLDGGTGKLYLAYLTTGGYVNMAQSADGVHWTSTVLEATGLYLNRDAIIFTHNQALWYGGQSYYSAHNLWLSGSWDGYTWGTGYNFGGVMSTSPSATNFNGALYALWRANDSSLWDNYVY